MIKTNPNIIKYYPKNSKYSMEAIKYNPKTLEYATDSIKSSETIVWELFQKDPSCLRYASPVLKAGPFAFKILECNEEAFKEWCYGPFIIRPTDSRDYILKLVSYGPYFSKIKLVYQNDEEIQLAALDHDASVWRLLRRELKNDRSLVLKHAKRNREILKHATQFLEDYKLMVELIEQDVKCLRYFDQDMREKLYLKDKHVLVHSLEKNDELKDMQDLKYLRFTVWYLLTRSMLQDRDIVMILLKKLCQKESENFKFDINGENITIINDFDNFKVILKNFRTEKEFFQLNLFALGLQKLLSYADASIKNDPIVIANLFKADLPLKGIRFDKNVMRELIPILDKYVIDFFTDMVDKQIVEDPEIFFNDSELMILAVTKQERCFEFASKDLKGNIEFVKNCLNANPNLFKKVDLDLVKDQMDKQLAIQCFNYMNDHNYENRIQKLKDFLEDSEVFISLASKRYIVPFERILETFKSLRNYEILKQDQTFAHNLLNINMNYYELFDPEFSKQLLIDHVHQKPTSFFNLNHTMQSNIEIVSTAYRKSEYEARIHWYITFDKKKLLDLLQRGVYCDNSLDSYFLDSSFIVDHCKHLII